MTKKKKTFSENLISFTVCYFYVFNHILANFFRPACLVFSAKSVWLIICQWCCKLHWNLSIWLSFPYFKFKVEHTQMATKQLLLLICIIKQGPIGQKQSALSKMWTFGTHWNLKMVNKSFSTAPLANQL